MSEPEPHIQPDALPPPLLDTDNNSSESLSEKDHTSVSNSSPSSTSTTSESFSISTLSEQLDLEDIFGAHKSYTSMKLVGDNLDKEVVPREMRSDYQKRSLHYFHAYAVKDRIDLSEVSDQKVQPDLQSIQLTELLPTGDDEDILRRNFTILICRVLIKHMQYFAPFNKAIDKHIQHDFSSQMSQKSEVVSVYLCVCVCVCVCVILSSLAPSLAPWPGDDLEHTCTHVLV